MGNVCTLSCVGVILRHMMNVTFWNEHISSLYPLIDHEVITPTIVVLASIKAHWATVSSSQCSTTFNCLQVSVTYVILFIHKYLMLYAFRLGFIELNTMQCTRIFFNLEHDAASAMRDWYDIISPYIVITLMLVFHLSCTYSI